MVWILLFSVIRSVKCGVCIYMSSKCIDVLGNYVLYLGGLFSAHDEFLYGFNKM